MQAFKEFCEYLSSFHPITEQLMAYLQVSVREKIYPKDYLLLQEGHIPDTIWFISRGSGARVFRKDPQTKEEFTIWFWKNELILPLDGMQCQLPSRTNISLSKRSTVISLSYIHLKYLNQIFPEYHHLNQAILENLSRKLSEHLDLIQHTDSTMRYEFIMENNSAIFNEGNLKDIASFLGMSISTIRHIRYGA